MFFFINSCLASESIAPTFVQHYGRQVLTEVIPRIKGVYPKKMMRQLAPVIQKLFARDMEGMPNVVMDVLMQVRCALARSACSEAHHVALKLPAVARRFHSNHG